MMKIQNPIIRELTRCDMPRKLLTKWKKLGNLPTNIYLSRFLARYIIGSEDTKKKYFVPKKIGTLLLCSKSSYIPLFNQEKKRRRSGLRVSSRKYHTHFNCIDHCLLCSFDTSTLSASFCLVRICEEGKGGVKGSGSAPRVQNEVGSTYAAS